MEPFEVSLPPDLLRLRELRKALAAWLETVDVPPSQRDPVVLATHEAAANSIEHACGRVTVRAVRDPDKVIVVVTNSGRWKGPNPPKVERGSGMVLMQGLMSRFEIRVDPERTTLRMGMDLVPEAGGSQPQAGAQHGRPS
jgi:serine/threonine-protein kinase RsbW